MSAPIVLPLWVVVAASAAFAWLVLETVGCLFGEREARRNAQRAEQYSSVLLKSLLDADGRAAKAEGRLAIAERRRIRDAERLARFERARDTRGRFVKREAVE